MEVEYTKQELANIIESVREAEYSDELPIHNWARAAKVLELVAAERLDLLRRCRDYLNDWLHWLETNTAKDNDDLIQLIDELAKELGDG